ncbi:response regulator [Pseudoduganella aquatica]|uniref:Response regulator n=1 Tax=Pseudoduganella aquatica TaxID=2660641 RepID=A0A7X4HDD8_9BURK|nr:response regulator [Pseudoduganella aquatica]MYN09153.1 response regulator [Pseudoduganella aquatica]
MPDYSNLSVLIVDPNQGMRASVHNMLTQVNITKVEHAVSAGTAIRALNKKNFDVILCEYDLGSAGGNEAGQDGQQLLEDLRLHRIISQWAIFIMLTSEGVYSKVVSAAELLPTDYILKPFTVDVLSQRIGRALERRATFLPVYQMIGQGKAREAIAACLSNETSQPRYATDYARLRAELLVNLDRLPEAEQAYTAIVASKPLGWAQLGRARCAFALKRYPDAQAQLEALVAENPKLMAAYDLLAQVLRAQRKDEEAKKVLEDAIAISPHMVTRLRNLGDVAYATGDIEGAEKAFKQVVAKAKYSEFRDPADHVNLVRTLVKKGDAAGAAGVIRDMERSLRSGPDVEVCRAYSSAMLQELNGKPEAAAAELAKAMALLSEATGMSSNIKLGLAHSCLVNRMDEQAAVLFGELTKDPDSGVSEADVVALCSQAGREDIARSYDQQLDSEVDAMVRQAAEKSRNADLAGAVEVLQLALRKRPDHKGLWTVAATAMLRQIMDLGWDATVAVQCTALLRRIRDDNPAHPLLPGLIAQYTAVRQKYAPPAATPTAPAPAQAAAETR